MEFYGNDLLARLERAMEESNIWEKAFHGYWEFCHELSHFAYYIRKRKV